MDKNKEWIQLEYGKDMIIRVNFQSDDMYDQFVEYMLRYNPTSFNTYMNILNWAEARGLKADVIVNTHLFSLWNWMLRLLMWLFEKSPDLRRQLINPEKYGAVSNNE